MENKKKSDHSCCGKHNEATEKKLAKQTESYSHKAHATKTPHQEFLEQREKQKSSKLYSR